MNRKLRVDFSNDGGEDDSVGSFSIYPYHHLLTVYPVCTNELPNYSPSLKRNAYPTTTPTE
jgi:hypothetical protein